MKLYYFHTLNSRKPCAVAQYLNSPVEFVYLDLRKKEQKTPEFLAINPNGKVPALEDGPNKIWESTAIMCYLAQKAGSDLWPKDERQVDIIRWFNWSSDHFSRLGGQLYFENIIKRQFGIGAPDAEKIAEASKLFMPHAAVLNNHLKGREYLVGNALTLADFTVAGLLPDAAEAGLPLDDFPEIHRWHDRLCQLQAWREPYPVDERVAS